MARAILQAKSTPESNTLFVALELGGAHWKVMASAGTTRVSEKSVRAGEIAALMGAIARMKARQGLGPEAAVVSCYEAGRDGFWLHRSLERAQVRNIVVDSSSIEVDRRARRAKTDRIDARKLLSMLQRDEGGEGWVWRTVHVPTVEQEDARRPHRELERLSQERTGHANRIGALLALQGLEVAVSREFPEQLATLRLRDGTALPQHLRAELERQWARWELVDRQLRAVQAERRERARHECSVGAEQVRQLMLLVGIGPASAWLLSEEIFAWRGVRNRRQLAALVGLTPTPYRSDGSGRERGISKAGNRRVRSVLVEIAWGWLRYQPHSALVQWFQQRFGHGSGRMRRVGIVALARRLLIALWRFVQDGVVPEGARLRAA